METRNRPTVVVIVPFYNGARWIERAIKSVIEQTITPDEFIIVNDGSKPEERAELGRLAEKYPFRIIDKENGGQGSARNSGVAASTSDFICFLDQDDMYLPTHNEDLLSIVPDSDPRFGYAYADLCEGDEDAAIVHTNMLRPQAGAHPKAGHILTMVRNDLFILPSASLISRKAFEEIGGFDEQFMGYEDDDLFLRFFRAGYTNHFLDKPVTIWCMHSGSTSWSIKMSRSRFKYFKKLVRLYPDDEHKKLFFMRDCLIPRFEKNFLDEAEMAIKKKSPDAPEMLGMLLEFQAIVERNENVRDDYKKLLTRSVNSIQGLPIPINALTKHQDALRQCYASTSWKVAKPLRSIYRKMKGLPQVEDAIPFDDNEAARKLQELWRSPSWKVSAPLRVIKRLAAPQVQHRADVDDEKPKTEFLVSPARKFPWVGERAGS